MVGGALLEIAGKPTALGVVPAADSFLTLHAWQKQSATSGKKALKRLRDRRCIVGIHWHARNQVGKI
jgi:hypothetical protein